jgi:LysM repeat protein
MKTTTCLMALTFAFCIPLAAAESLDDLKRRCAEQERQIEALETENRRLRADLGLAARPDSRSSESVPAPVTTASPRSATHTVKAGESLSKIAKRHGTTPEALAELNGLKNPGLIRIGQKLELPAAESGEGKLAAAETVRGTHKVKSGETFFSIARKYGLSTEALAAANPEVDPRKLRPGREIALVARKTEATGSLRETPSAEPEKASDEGTRSSDALGSGTQTILNHRRIEKVRIEEPIRFGEFAAKHSMDPERLNRLNGLNLTPNRVLKEGSALYVSAQPLD